MKNPWAQDLTDPFNPAAAFDQGILAMPAAYGFTEAAVRAAGVPNATRAAQVIANRKRKRVLVPIPGKGKSVVVKPQKKRSAVAYLPRRKAAVLDAQVRAPMPDAYTKLGRRGPMPPKSLWRTALLALKRQRQASAVERQEDAVAARRSSNMVPGKRMMRKPAGRPASGVSPGVRKVAASAKAASARHGVYDPLKIALVATAAVAEHMRKLGRPLSFNDRKRVVHIFERAIKQG